MKQFKNVALTVSTPADSAPAPVIGQVIEGRVSHCYEFSGEIRQHWEVSLPAGRSQQQQMYPGTNGAWVNSGEPLVFTAPTTHGYDIPLNKNTAIQFVYVGA